MTEEERRRRRALGDRSLLGEEEERQEQVTGRSRSRRALDTMANMLTINYSGRNNTRNRVAPTVNEQPINEQPIKAQPLTNEVASTGPSIASVRADYLQYVDDISYPVAQAIEVAPTYIHQVESIPAFTEVTSLGHHQIMDEQSVPIANHVPWDEVGLSQKKRIRKRLKKYMQHLIAQGMSEGEYIPLAQDRRRLYEIYSNETEEQINERQRRARDLFFEFFPSEYNDDDASDL